jgi:TolB protein
MTDKDSSRQKSFRLNRRHLLTGMASLSMITGLSTRQAVAQKRIPIPEGEFVPLPIALPNFAAGTPSDGEVSVAVTQVITSNLKRSGLFAPIDQAAFIDKIINFDALPQFQNWRTISAQALVTGRMTRQGDGRLKAEFRLWDVATGQPLIGQQYFTQPENWNVSPGRRAISIPASCSSTKRAPRSGGSSALR